MQLSKLNSAIRAADDVKIRFSFGDVKVQKTDLLRALKEKFGTERTRETGFTLEADIDGTFFVYDREQPAAQVRAQALTDLAQADADLIVTHELTSAQANEDADEVTTVGSLLSDLGDENFEFDPDPAVQADDEDLSSLA